MLAGCSVKKAREYYLFIGLDQRDILCSVKGEQFVGNTIMIAEVREKEIAASLKIGIVKAVNCRVIIDQPSQYLVDCMMGISTRGVGEVFRNNLVHDFASMKA